MVGEVECERRVMDSLRVKGGGERGGRPEMKRGVVDINGSFSGN